MYKITKIRELAPNVREYVIFAPQVAKHSRAGQFIILRIDENGERVPFTICDYDREEGTITILVQAVGHTTLKMCELNVGDEILDFVGPLGNATELEEFKNVVLVGGGIGTAVIYPQAKYLTSIDKKTTVIIGARTKNLVMYEDNFKAHSTQLFIMTNDGSYGELGFVTNKLKELLDTDKTIDCVFAVGPLPMMKAVSDMTKGYTVHTIVSMNSVMVDGTGMCGGCRLTVGGEVKYACVDGPEFDGHKIDFDEAIKRNSFYNCHEGNCRLKGGKNAK